MKAETMTVCLKHMDRKYCFLFTADISPESDYEELQKSFRMHV